MASPRSTTARRARLGPPTCVALVLVIVVTAACGGAVTPSQPGFCRRVSANLDALRNVADPSQASKTLDAYRKIAAVAPAGVRDAWTTLTAVIESAATKDISQPGAEAAFAQRILASKPAIDTILAYTKDNCGIDLAAPPPTSPPTTAPPTTIAPTTELPVTTTPATETSAAEAPPTSTVAEATSTSASTSTAPTTATATTAIAATATTTT
jgi:hypothetical protein